MSFYLVDLASDGRLKFQPAPHSVVRSVIICIVVSARHHWWVVALAWWASGVTHRRIVRRRRSGKTALNFIWSQLAAFRQVKSMT